MQRSISQTEQFPKALGLSAANRDFGLLPIIHSQLVRTLEPGNHLADAIDIHQVRTVRPPEQTWIQAVEQLFKRPAIRLTLHAGRTPGHNRDHAVFNRRITDIPLVHKKHASQRLEQDFRGLRFLGLQHPNQTLNLLRRYSVPFLLGLGLLHRLRDALFVEWLQQIVHGVYLERLDGVLVKCRSKDNLWQGDFLVQQFLDHTEAVEAGHLHVEENQIGAVLFDEVDGFKTVLALRDNIDVARAFTQVSEFVAGELVIVHDYRR